MPKSEKPDAGGEPSAAAIGDCAPDPDEGPDEVDDVPSLPVEPTSETSDKGISVAPSTSIGVVPDMSTAVTIALLAMVEVIAVPSDAVAATLNVYWPSGSWLPFMSLPSQLKSLLPWAGPRVRV